MPERSGFKAIPCPASVENAATQRLSPDSRRPVLRRTQRKKGGYVPHHARTADFAIDPVRRFRPAGGGSAARWTMLVQNWIHIDVMDGPFRPQ